MHSTITIKGLDQSRVLSFDLIDILGVIEPEGRRLIWSILSLEEATGDLTSLGMSLTELEQRVDESPRGVLLDWDKLVSFARAINQVVDGLFAGCRDESLIPERGPGSRRGGLYESSEIVIEAVDSSYWEVYTPDEEVIRRLQAHFQDTEVEIGPEVIDRLRHLWS